MEIDQNTQIGPDGKRYPIGSVPTEPWESPRPLVVVYGPRAEGDVVTWVAANNRYEWAAP